MIVSSGYRKNGFDASGGKVLKKSDMYHWENDRLMTDPAGICFELSDEVEKVEQGFFEMLPTIREIRINNPECMICMTDETVRLFQTNKVLIRGGFDTAAERFAREYALRFLHLDAEIGRAGDYFERGVDIITLCFYSDGSAYINQDCRCQGISAGNTGGGEVDFDLPADCYLTMTASDVAALCWGTCYEKIVGGPLGAILKRAKEKNGFYFDFSKPD